MKRLLILLLAMLLMGTSLALAEEGISAKPIVHALMVESIGVSGAGVPGSTIQVTWVGGNVSESTLVGEDGQWVVYPSNGFVLRAGDQVQVTQTQAGAETSATVVRTAGKTNAPSVHDIAASAATITGEGIPSAQITVSFPRGGGTVLTTVGGGVWVVNVPAGVLLQDGDIVKVSQQEGILLASTELSIRVGDVTYVETAPAASTVIGNCKEWVNVRSIASTTGKAIGRANLGEAIEILGWDNAGEWANVRYSGGTGWVHGKFIIAP